MDERRRVEEQGRDNEIENIPGVMCSEAHDRNQVLAPGGSERLRSRGLTRKSCENDCRAVRVSISVSTPCGRSFSSYGYALVYLFCSEKIRETMKDLKIFTSLALLCRVKSIANCFVLRAKVGKLGNYFEFTMSLL